MQFVLLIIHADGARWGALTTDERNQVHMDCGAWHKDLVERGHAVMAQGLLPPDTATTVAERDGKISVTDGPFAETKEYIGGFEIIECATKEEAIAIAEAFPALRAGAVVEVRPVVPGGECRE